MERGRKKSEAERVKVRKTRERGRKEELREGEKRRNIEVWQKKL